MVGYKIAEASEYIVTTGAGITDIKISKKKMVWPFQKSQRMSIEPTTFEIDVDAMSAQRIPFRMPSVWTIGPEDNQESLHKYAKFLLNKDSQGLQETIAGVIQGEIRVLTANIELGQLFSDRDRFKNEVVQKITEIMKPFGLVVYNANIAELTDLDDDNRFFAEQKTRALQRVNQEARVATAEAIKDGEIGERRFRTETRQQVACSEKEAKLVENERDREVAESDMALSVAKAEYNQKCEIAKEKARAAAEKAKWQAQMEVEEMRKAQELERKRADKFTSAEVAAEIAIKEASGHADAAKISADGSAAKAKIEAKAKIDVQKDEAMAYAESARIKAEADLFVLKQQAEAALYKAEKEAQGILAVRQAEAEGLRQLVEAAGGTDNLNRYKLIDDGVLPELADKQAKAIQGLNPRVSVWNTGNGAGADGKASLSSVLTDLFQTGMPLFDGIKQQTGYDFLSMVKQVEDQQGSQKAQSSVAAPAAIVAAQE